MRTLRPQMKGLAAAVGMTLLLASCAAQPDNGGGAGEGESLETMDPVVLTFADLSSAESAIGKAAVKFMEVVEERTNGKVTFEPYWGGSLFMPTEALASVQSSVADISQFTTGYAPQELAVANWYALAGDRADSSFPQNMLENYGATTEMYRTNSALQAEFAKVGVTPLYMSGSPNFDMICAKEVSDLDSAEGIRARVSNETGANEVHSMGMTSMFAQSTELYEGLQRGVMDCASVVATYYADTGLLDVAKFYLPVALNASLGSGYIMNSDTLDSLPKDVQKIIMEATVDWQVEYAVQQMVGFNGFVAKADEGGVEFVDPRALEKSLFAFQQERFDGMSDDAPAGLDDAKGFLDQYESIVEKWKGIVVDDMGLELTERTGENIRKSYLTDSSSIDWDVFREALRSTLAG